MTRTNGFQEKKGMEWSDLNEWIESNSIEFEGDRVVANAGSGNQGGVLHGTPRNV